MKTALACLLLASVLLAEGFDLPRLVAALGDEKEEVAKEAERELLIAGPDALPLLRRAAEEDLDRLASLGPRVADLVRDLDADDSAAREQAEKALVDAGPAAIPALREAAAKGSAEAKARAQRALGHIRSGKSSAVTRLARLAEAVGAQADDACVPDLLVLASRLAAADSSAAIDGLWRLATPAAKAALQALAADADVARRWSARAALLDLGETPPGKLEDFLKEWPPAPLRMRVAKALQISELPEVVPVAMAAWEKEEDDKVADQFWYVLTGSADAEALTTGALRALAIVPPEKRRGLPWLLCRRTAESERVLRGLLADPDEETREAAASQLLPLLGDDALPDLLALRDDPADGMLWKALPQLDALVGRDPAPFLGVLTDRHAFGALLPAFVRSEGADEARRIPERWGSLSTEEEAVLGRVAKSFVYPTPPENLSYFASTQFNCGTSTVLYSTLRILTGSPPPDPRVQTQQTDAFADPYRKLCSLSPDERRESLRASLRESACATQLHAVRAAILLDVDGLEEHVLPLLSFAAQGGSDDELQRAARGYLAGRKTPDLLGRVRKMAEGDMPGAAAALWVDWEGRPAAEALVGRLKGMAPLGILQALAEAPLRPEDAALLLGARADEKWYQEPQRWTAALLRTGAPEALHEAAEIVLSPDRAKYAAPEAYAGLLRDAAPLALRIARAGMEPAQPYPGSGWTLPLSEAPCPEAAEMLVRLLDAAPLSAEWFAKALARGDPAKAREAAAVRRSSRHLAKRMEALWIDLYLGERPTAEELEPLLHLQRYAVGESGIRALVLLAEPRDLEPLVAMLCNPDPELRRAALWLLEVSTAHALDDMRNDLFIPCEARAAWKAWLEAHKDAKRSDLLEQGLRDAGYGAGLEARVRACAEGPWYLAGAVMVAEGRGYSYFTCDYCQAIAAFMKTAPRSK